VYGLAYVLIPPAFKSLQAELDRSLASFMRGGDDVFPRSALAFDDVTDELARLHQIAFTYASKKVTWQAINHDCAYYLRSERVLEHLDACGIDHFEGTLAELEPSFDAFVSRFTRYEARDGTTSRYGRWFNPLGYWDWWELGGRFNGVITGDPRPAASNHSISSGVSSGRALMETIGAMLGAPEPDEKTLIEANVELVETLRERAKKVRDHRMPTAVVLPPAFCLNENRWFDCVEWHDIKPGTRLALGVSTDSGFRTLVQAAYARLPDHAVAGVAYHF
jgi:hypothetical protein